MASDTNSRFTRRKQLNPRRKNVDPESMGPDEGPLSHSAASAGDDEETLEEPEDRLVIDSGSPAPGSPVPSTKTHDQKSPCNGFHRLLRGSGSPPSSNTGDPPSSPPSSPPPRLNGHLNLSEAEKIREYLGRSDTAVIFPEPVDIAEPKREQATDRASSPAGLPCTIPLASESQLGDHCQRRPPLPPSREGATEAAPDSPSEERLHVCGKCKAAFSQRTHLERHQAGHAASATPTTPANNQSCHRCNKPFANVYRLQRHMLSHDESSVLRKFKCPECGKAFKFKHHLKEHIRIHSGEKPFACQNCGKRFSHSGSYSSHMTSKKCLVVNLKVRKIDVKSSRSRSSAPTPGNGLTMPNNNNNSSSSNNNAFRPIIPKYGASPEPATSYLQDRFPFPVVSEGQALQPFLPAYASVNFHTLLASHFQGLPPYVPFAGFPDMASLLQQGLHPSPCKEEPLPYRAPSPSPVRQHQDATGKNSPDHQPLGSALNAVKKILQIVDATVSKQRLDARLSPVPVVASPASPRAEVKESGDGPTTTASPSRCRFCDEPFESNIDLHQHERYLCKLNRDRPASKEEEDEDGDGRESRNGHVWTPPRRLLVQSEERNGLPSSSPRPPEDVKPSCEDLKALLSAHPRSKKGELLKATREMGYPMKAIQGWFRRRPQERTPSPQPIQVPVYKPYAALGPPSAHLNSPRVDESPSPTPFVPDQPLDLSVKGKPNSCKSLLPFTADGALNLSHKSSRLGLKDEDEESRRHWGSPLLLPRATPADSLTDTLAQRLQRNGFLGGRSSLSPADSESHSTSDSVRGDFPPDYHPKYLHGNPVLALGSGGGPVQRSPDRFPYPEEARPGSSSDPASCSPSPDGCMPHTELLMHGKAPFLAGDYDDAEQRRIFKKLWKQDELDENGMCSLGVGCEDVSSGDLLDDVQGTKRRKTSWKPSSLQVAVPNCKLEADEGVYSCDQCDKTFSKQSSLARHKYEHSGQRPHKCDVCSKAFKHKHHLTEHKRLHSGEKPFQCQKCLKRFSHSGSYSQHMNHRYSYCKPYRE